MSLCVAMQSLVDLLNTENFELERKSLHTPREVIASIIVSLYNTIISLRSYDSITKRGLASYSQTFSHKPQSFELSLMSTVKC